MAEALVCFKALVNTFKSLRCSPSSQSLRPKVPSASNSTSPGNASCEEHAAVKVEDRQAQRIEVHGADDTHLSVCAYEASPCEVDVDSTLRLDASVDHETTLSSRRTAMIHARRGPPSPMARFRKRLPDRSAGVRRDLFKGSCGPRKGAIQPGTGCIKEVNCDDKAALSLGQPAPALFHLLPSTRLPSPLGSLLAPEHLHLERLCAQRLTRTATIIRAHAHAHTSMHSVAFAGGNGRGCRRYCVAAPPGPRKFQDLAIKGGRGCGFRYSSGMCCPQARIVAHACLRICLRVCFYPFCWSPTS